MLPAGDQVEVPPHPGYQQVASPVHYTTSCKHSLVLLKMGEIIARKHVKLIEITNSLTPNDPYMGRTAPLTSKRCILYIFIQQM